jgi:hypothetical protein
LQGARGGLLPEQSRMIKIKIKIRIKRRNATKEGDRGRGRVGVDVPSGPATPSQVKVDGRFPPECDGFIGSSVHSV